MDEVTRILQAIQDGDPTAAEDLLPIVYDHLRRLAAWQMSRESPGQTLQPTALVHEAWLRLVGAGDPQWEGRRRGRSDAAHPDRHRPAQTGRLPRRGAPPH